MKNQCNRFIKHPTLWIKGSRAAIYLPVNIPYVFNTFPVPIINQMYKILQEQTKVSIFYYLNREFQTKLIGFLTVVATHYNCIRILVLITLMVT